MSNLINRDIQRRLLEELLDIPSNEKDYSEERPTSEELANLKYLKDHGLIEWEARYMDDDQLNVFSTTITARGIDYMLEDGGLTEELNVVTIKLHADTINELLIAKIQSSEAGPTVKQNLVKKLKELPADAVKELLMTIINKGIDSIPDVAKWLPTFLHSLQ